MYTKNDIVKAIEFYSAEIREQENKLMDAKADATPQGERNRNQAKHNLEILNTTIEVLKDKRDWM